MVRRKKRSSSAKKTVSVKKKTHTVDGIIYASKEMADMHRLLNGNPVVKSFHLPSLKEEKSTNTGRFKAKKCEINGQVFDSIMEGKYYVYLLEQKKFGFIKDFSMQVEYTLMEKYRNVFTNKIIRPIKYIADFVVTKSDNTKEAIDVKGIETPEFKMKAKLFGSKYPDIKLTCYQWSNKYGNRWIDLDELKLLRKEDKKKKKSKQ